MKTIFSLALSALFVLSMNTYAALRDGDIAIRLAAIKVLTRGDIGDFYVAPHLFDLVSDACPHVRRAAKLAVLKRLFPRTERG